MQALAANFARGVLTIALHWSLQIPRIQVENHASHSDGHADCQLQDAPDSGVKYRCGPVNRRVHDPFLRSATPQNSLSC
jgi:hypothetical protein